MKEKEFLKWLNELNNNYKIEIPIDYIVDENGNVKVDIEEMTKEFEFRLNKIKINLGE